jgi:hypothetical protein
VRLAVQNREHTAWFRNPLLDSRFHPELGHVTAGSKNMKERRADVRRWDLDKKNQASIAKTAAFEAQATRDSRVKSLSDSPANYSLWGRSVAMCRQSELAVPDIRIPGCDEWRKKVHVTRLGLTVFSPNPNPGWHFLFLRPLQIPIWKLRKSSGHPKLRTPQQTSLSTSTPIKARSLSPHHLHLDKLF